MPIFYIIILDLANTMEIELTFFRESLCGTKWFAEQSDWIHFSSWNREAADWMKGSTQSQDNQSKFHPVTCAEAWLKMISWVNLILFRRFPPHPTPFFFHLEQKQNKIQTTGSLVMGSEEERSMMTGEHSTQTGFGKQIRGIGRKLGNEGSSPGKEERRNKLQTSQTPGWETV